MNLFPNKKEAVEVVLERELYRVAKRLTRSDVDAEDIVSQTMIAAFKNWDRFDGQHPRSWLVRILNNEWLQVLRRRKVRSEVEMSEHNEPQDHDFWKQIDSNIEAKSVIKCLDELPEEYRLAVTLCDVEELTYEEAAEALDIPIGTVRSRLFRGRRILRHKLVEVYA
jgi:RNA polymerase sigma-70 factor, ECF subfamily